MTPSQIWAKAALLLSLGALAALHGALLAGCDEAAEAGCEADCPAAFCQADSTCSAARCDAPGACPVDQYCDQDIKRCLPGCETDKPCDGGLVCDPATHQCSPCDDAQARSCLPIVGVCDAGSGRCVQCTSDVNCDRGERGAYCQPTLNRCVEGCLRPVNCPVSLQCDATIGQCVECLTNDDCTGVCDNGQCVECIQDPGCGVGTERYCDPDLRACLPGCVQDISCPQGKTCDLTQRVCQ
jgi:hypothetical protein